MTRVVLGDELLDAQLLRTMGAAGSGGADVAECIEAARAVDGTNLDSWHDAWVTAAQRVRDLAQAEERAGHRETARLAYLRASSYYRTAGVMLFASPPDPRLVATNSRQTEMFRCAGRLMLRPPEVIAIPFEGSSLPGYFFRAGDDGAPRATIVLLGGYDGTAEELYFFTGAAALARGYNVLAFDGPGQGAALLQQQLFLRPGWETVISPVIDYAIARSDVDAARIALIGLSLGAYLGPRAAAHEHRIAALIADCGSFDMQASFLSRLPPPLAVRYAAGNTRARTLLGYILKKVERKPTAGWALRRGQQVHNVTSPLAYLDSLAAFSLADEAALISCPTWVCNAEGDDIGASAPQLFEALTSPKEFVQFTAAEGAGDHCEAGARGLYHARSFGWLDDLLHPEQPG
jgi:alpha-beta hydrolase superfamily lysophospholipase